MLCIFQFKFLPFLFLDSAFTERIMGYPNENVKMYVEADATQRSKHIPSDSLYLIHGLADISVPYQHSVALAHALAKEGIMFKYQVRRLSDNCLTSLEMLNRT